MNTYKLEVFTPREIPAAILGEAVDRAVSELFNLDTDTERPEVIIYHTLPEDEQPAEVGLPKIPELTGIVEQADLSPDLQNIIRWAAMKKAHEDNEERAAVARAQTVTGRHPKGVLRNLTFPVEDIKEDENGEARYYINVPKDLAKQIGFRQIDGLSIQREGEEPVSTHFQEPVAQPGKRPHPFDGPEVFDDKSVSESTPRLQELIEAKRPAREVPEGEGDWQLPAGDDKVGEDK